MNIPSYTRTAGLERYPEQERFTVYRMVQKRLLSEDSAYRRHCQCYIAIVVCLAIVPIIGWAAVVVLAFHEQAFQNQKIGDVLQSRPDTMLKLTGNGQCVLSY